MKITKLILIIIIIRLLIIERSIMSTRKVVIKSIMIKVIITT